MSEQLARELLDAVEALVSDPSLQRHADRRARATERLRVAYNAVVAAAPTEASPHQGPLTALDLAVAMNSAQIDPTELRLGRDLLPVAERILARLGVRTGDRLIALLAERDRLLEQAARAAHDQEDGCNEGGGDQVEHDWRWHLPAVRADAERAP